MTTPHALAENLRKHSRKLKSAGEPSPVTAEPNGAGFFYYCPIGGILHVTVTQYKGPLL